MWTSLLVASALAADPVVRADLPYRTVAGQDRRLTSLDTHSVPGRDGPILVFVHGGSWRSGDKANAVEKSPMVGHFLDGGWSFVAVNHRLVADGKGTTPLDQADDVAASLRWVVDHRDELGGGPIALVGYSSGAHLVSLVAADPRHLGRHGLGLDVLSAVVALDVSAYDIPRAIAEGCDQGWCVARSNLTGVFGSDPDVLRDASPVHHLASAKPALPAFLVVSAPVNGRREQTLSRVQSERFVVALRNAGATAEHLHAEGRSHTSLAVRLGEEGEPVTEAVDRFLAAALAKPSE